MGKVLVLGGTRHFGKRLVNLLAQNGEHQVTVATRGLVKAEFDSAVNHLILDRRDEASLIELARSEKWDIVFDNICLSREEALSAVKAFDGQVGRFILTSSQSVYGFEKTPIDEADFYPYTYDLKMEDQSDFDYGERKRLAEAVFFQKANFPVAAMRIPIVLGPDDPTRRLHFHVEHVQAGIPIGMPNTEATISFISSGEAADFLYWLGHSDITGPIHASSCDPLTLREMLNLIEQATERKALIVSNSKQESASPFGVLSSWVLDTSKAKALGYRFKKMNDWMPELIQQIVPD